MHIELSELLRCPEQHEEVFCVVFPDVMEGRTVVSGLIGCPACGNEYPIRGGVAVFAANEPAAEQADAGRPTVIDALTAQALLNLTGPGGHVALVGSASLLTQGLIELVDGIHFVACNAPAGVRSTSRVSVLYAPASIPMRSSSMRGVVLGAEMAAGPWPAEATRILLRGTRILCIGRPSCPDGIRQLAARDGIAVGEKI